MGEYLSCLQFSVLICRGVAVILLKLSIGPDYLANVSGCLKVAT